MPKRGHDSPKPKQRTPRSVVKDQLPLPQELQRTVSTNIRAKELKGLEYEVNERRMMMLDPFLIQKFEIIIDDSLGFTIKRLPLCNFY